MVNFFSGYTQGILDREEWKRQADAAMKLMQQKDRARYKKQCDGCGAREYVQRKNQLRCAYCGGLW